MDKFHHPVIPINAYAVRKRFLASFELSLVNTNFDAQFLPKSIFVWHPPMPGNAAGVLLQVCAYMHVCGSVCAVCVCGSVSVHVGPARAIANLLLTKTHRLVLD